MQILINIMPILHLTPLRYQLTWKTCKTLRYWTMILGRRDELYMDLQADCGW